MISKYCDIAYVSYLINLDDKSKIYIWIVSKKMLEKKSFYDIQLKANYKVSLCRTKSFSTKMVLSSNEFTFILFQCSD